MDKNVVVVAAAAAVVVVVVVRRRQWRAPHYWWNVSFAYARTSSGCFVITPSDMFSSPKILCLFKIVAGHDIQCCRVSASNWHFRHFSSLLLYGGS